MLEAGGSFAQLLRSGQWHLSAIQLYQDFGCEGAQAMASILIEAWVEGRQLLRGLYSAMASCGVDG